MSTREGLTERVVFRHPFILPGLDDLHRPGTFDVVTEWEALDVSWPAFQLTVMILLTDAGRVEAIGVTRGDLDAALRRDSEEHSSRTERAESICPHRTIDPCYPPLLARIPRARLK